MTIMPDTTFTIYWLPHCSTCQRATKYVKEKGIAIKEFRDIKSEPLTRKEVERLAELVGSANELFSRRARKYRSMNLSEQKLSSGDMIQLMADEYTFIKRPVLVCGEAAIAGFSSSSYDSFLKIV